VNCARQADSRRFYPICAFSSATFIGNVLKDGLAIELAEAIKGKAALHDWGNYSAACK
jgi:hypothetical protein